MHCLAINPHGVPVLAMVVPRRASLAGRKASHSFAGRVNRGRAGHLAALGPQPSTGRMGIAQFSSTGSKHLGNVLENTRTSALPLSRSPSLSKPSRRSGLSDIQMHDGARGWDLSHELALFHFREDGEFDERTLPMSEILHTLGLTPSTSFLRKVRSTQIQKVICEGSTIFLTLGDFRAFIAAEQVFLFGTHRTLIKDQANVLKWALSLGDTKWTGGADAAETHSRATALPYEMRALETMLAAVTDTHESRLGVLAPVIAGMLSKLEAEDTVAVGIVQSAEREEVLLQKLLPLTKATETFRLAVHETRDALSQLLQCEFELAQMQLSWRKDTGKDQPTKEEAYFLSQRTRQVLATTERCGLQHTSRVLAARNDPFARVYSSVRQLPSLSHCTLVWKNSLTLAAACFQRARGNRE